MSNENKDRKDELDQFWDISRLVPQKPRKTSVPSRPLQKASPVLVQDRVQSPHDTSSSQEKLTISTAQNLPKNAEEATVFAEYSNCSPLISHVKIVNWKSSYNYYEFFCQQAAMIHKKHGADCPEAPFVPFFSYVAQYTQLNRRQLAWYLWWRECARNGKYLKTDISYINLFIFEIINLGNKIDTKKALDILIGLWENYGDEFPQLNGTLGEWICDYSLIHNLSVHFSEGRMRNEAVLATSLPEVFCHIDLQDPGQFAKLLLSSCCSYNYRKSKFYRGENIPIYDRYIPQAVCSLLEQIDISRFLSEQPKKTVIRMAYTGALCSYKTRKHIEVEYIPLCESHDIKARLGDVVKYAENKIRSYLGIRSRLGIRQIDSRAAAEIDAYFSCASLAESYRKVPEYERLYESEETNFSISSALDIEKQAWEITEKLVETFEEEIPSVQPKEEAVLSAPTQDMETRSTREVFVERISRHAVFFTFILENKGKEQLEYARQKNLLPEGIVDELNECAIEIFGDILIEEAELGYRVIEEYRSIFE